MLITSMSKLQLALIAMMMLITPVFAGSDSNDHEGSKHGKSMHPKSISGVNKHGSDKTYSTAGFIDLNNAFFKKFGTNDRTCATCHVPTEGWVITPKGIQERFKKTQGTDPVFRLVDGANSPHADVSTVEKRRQAYSMLLDKANIRVGIGIPADAEFTLAEVDDPYGFASATELSLFRRPMPTTNLKFISAVMWDGRETTRDSNSTNCIFETTTCFSPIAFDLSTQANHATLGHAEAAAALTDAEKAEIVAFEIVEVPKAPLGPKVKMPPPSPAPADPLTLLPLIVTLLIAKCVAVPAKIPPPTGDAAPIRAGTLPERVVLVYEVFPTPGVELVIVIPPPSPSVVRLFVTMTPETTKGVR